MHEIPDTKQKDTKTGSRRQNRPIYQRELKNVTGNPTLDRNASLFDAAPLCYQVHSELRH